MLISCPYCGPRDVAEFTYQGDGNRDRPNPMSQDLGAWNEYVFDRVNLAGDHNEIWQHSGGCRSHVAVVRNTLTHKISSVRMVRDAAPAPVTARREPSTVQTRLEQQALTRASAAPKPKRPANKPKSTAPAKSATGATSAPTKAKASSKTAVRTPRGAK